MEPKLLEIRHLIEAYVKYKDLLKQQNAFLKYLAEQQKVIKIRHQIEAKIEINRYLIRAIFPGQIIKWKAKFRKGRKLFKRPYFRKRYGKFGEPLKQGDDNGSDKS